MKVPTIFSIKSKPRIFATTFGMIAFGAIACISYDEPVFDVTVGGVSLQDPWREIGARLEEQIGDAYGTDVDVNGVVRYSVKLPFGLLGGQNAVPFRKPCGQTFEEAARDRFKTVYISNGNFSMCAVDAGNPVVRYEPIYQSGSVCTPGGCQTVTQLVGYMPVHAAPLPLQHPELGAC